MIDLVDQNTSGCASGGTILWRVATHGGRTSELRLGGGEMGRMLMEMKEMVGGIYREVGE